MSQLSDAIKSMFSKSNRHNNFGESLNKVVIDGFRGIEDLTITFDFPITALSGLNGSGKSTIGQICACAYKTLIPSSLKRYYIYSFFPVSDADPAPITLNSSVKYYYNASGSTSDQEVTISRKKSSWSGYKRQPLREVHYIGFTIYIPKVERRDLSIYSARNITLGKQRQVNEAIRKQVSRILNSDYQDIAFQEVKHLKKVDEIGMVTKYGQKYSENHMGFGEGRLLYMIDLLESASDRSLFILEEPETSLHEQAEHEFTKYLLDVCKRKKHQIIISTHSEVILNALPPEARKVIIREPSGVKLIDRISSSMARSILSGGHNHALTIFAEDKFAKLLILEIIRSYDNQLIKAVKVIPCGDTSTVNKLLKLAHEINLNAIAIRDGDVGSDPQNLIFSLPGFLAPEKEMFNENEVISKIDQHYSINSNAILNIKNIEDHHLFIRTIADEICMDEEGLSIEFIRHYIEVKGKEFFSEIINIIKKHI